MDVVNLLLLLAAIVCFILAGLGAAVRPRINLIGIGLAFWVAITLIAAFQALGH